MAALSRERARSLLEAAAQGEVEHNIRGGIYQHVFRDAHMKNVFSLKPIVPPETSWTEPLLTCFRLLPVKKEVWASAWTFSASHCRGLQPSKAE